MKTSLEIKQTLIQIAEKAGRPHYELAVVRDVIRAVKTGADHPLKSAVLNHGVAMVADTVFPPALHHKSRIEKLIAFCEPSGMKLVLAKQAGVSYRALCEILRQAKPMGAGEYKMFASAFDRAETEFARRAATLKVNTHGSWACYSKGCRCAECSTTAHLKYLARKYGKAA